MGWALLIPVLFGGSLLSACSSAEILMPPSGPLSFDLSPSQIGQTQSAAFDLSFSVSSVHIELEFTLEDLGISYESVAGTFDDVLVFNLAIHSSEAGSVYSEHQSIRIWLARGFGPIHAEKSKDDTRTGGDFLRN